MGVVQGPVCNGRARDIGRKGFRRFGREPQGHVTAIGPSPDANARWVDICLCFQKGEARQLVFNFWPTQFSTNGALKATAPVRRSAVVDGKYNVAARGMELIGIAAPATPDDLHAGSAIDIDDDWPFLAGVEIGWQLQ